MANRTFFGVQSSNREVKIIATKVKLAAEGATVNATAVLTDSDGNDIATNGIESVEWGSDSGTSLTDKMFRIKLADKYEAALAIQVTKATDGGGTAAFIEAVSENVSGGSAVAPVLGTPSVVVTASEDLVDGDAFFVTMFLLNTSVTR